MSATEDTRALLIGHCRTYPRLRIADMLKFLHQSAFGCEHLLSDPSFAVGHIREEAAICAEHTGKPVEPLDGAYCRVHLDYLKKGLSADTLGRLFFLSAEHTENGVSILEEKLAVMLELAKQGVFPFSAEEAGAAVRQWRDDGFPAQHHSDAFRGAYAPAYRVIKKDYAAFLPLFARIDEAMQQGRVTLAVEGGSASGKTTLSGLLKKVYGCAVFHMDDFFLRPEQRTEERLSEPGGNVDRERFLSEVLFPLSQNSTIHYRRFDCGSTSLLPPVVIQPGRLNVIEGAYSMHPELAEHYDLSVFLDITPALQKERILKRNSNETAKRFFAEWIPLEHRYFEDLNVKERCDIVLPAPFL